MTPKRFQSILASHHFDGRIVIDGDGKTWIDVYSTNEKPKALIECFQCPLALSVLCKSLDCELNGKGKLFLEHPSKAPLVGKNPVFRLFKTIYPVKDQVVDVPQAKVKKP